MPDATQHDEQPWRFRLESQVRPSAIPGAPPQAVWVVHTAVKPTPGLEVDFTVTPIEHGRLPKEGS